MSDTADDFDPRGRSSESDTDPLRERMREFVDSHETADVVELREGISSGTDLSKIVTSDRDERV